MNRSKKVVGVIDDRMFHYSMRTSYPVFNDLIKNQPELSVIGIWETKEGYYPCDELPSVFIAVKVLDYPQFNPSNHYQYSLLW